MKQLVNLLVLVILLSTSCYGQSDTSFYVVDYQPDKKVINYQDTAFIDLDGNGTVDFKFYYGFTSVGRQPILANYDTLFRWNSLDTNDLRLLTDTSLKWYSGNDWTVHGKYYIVMRLEKDGQYYYGWILWYGMLEQGATLNKTIFVDKHAFCKIANYGIRVGQTSRAESVGIPGNQSPPTEVTMQVVKEGIHLGAATPISAVYLYNLNGQLLYQSKVSNQTSFLIPNPTMNHTILVVKTILANGEVVSRKVAFGL